MSDQQYADNIIPIYKKYAIEWDKVRSQHFYEQVWLEQFLNLIPDQSSILDLGCGT
ncbi:MAG TPA: SAM-dependent methyltransferase, partial [Acinetobacter radioresistens]|nr:SAM-dependent methyltransferase [Acinetobacter radioresistens]